MDEKETTSQEDFSKKSITFNLEEEKQIPKKQKVKHEEIGVSYDSSKMRSTLVHIDIEEVCRCFSKVIHLSIQIEEAPQESQQRHSTRQSSTSSLRYSDSRTLPNAVISRYEEVYFEPFRSQLSIEESEIYNFTKNVLIRSKMEKEIPIVCLVYLERLESRTGLRLTNFTWKRLLFTSLVIASKIWDDDSYENKNFADSFTLFRIEEINAMESAFLNMLDFDLNVKGGEYAKAYFRLRTFFDSKSRSFPLKALDVETVRRLQGKTANAEVCLRGIHADTLYKTL